MEAWRPEPEGDKRRTVVSAHNLTLALVAHVAVFAVFFLYSVVQGLFEKQDDVIPIDLTIVVNENLEGKENEPPPLDDPPPPPPKPKPKPKPKKVVKKPDPPKALEQMVTNIVAKVDKKDEPKEKPDAPKVEQKPEEPKKSKAELRKERLAKMREAAKNTNKRPVEIKVKNQPSGDGRTDKKTLTNDQIQKLLNQGYKPGTSTHLANGEMQFALSLIKQAFEAKWNAPARTPNMRPMTMQVWFGPGGRVLQAKLVGSSGDARADQSIRLAAQQVKVIPRLPQSFIEAYGRSGIEIEFKVD